MIKEVNYSFPGSSEEVNRLITICNTRGRHSSSSIKRSGTVLTARPQRALGPGVVVSGEVTRSHGPVNGKCESRGFLLPESFIILFFLYIYIYKCNSFHTSYVLLFIFSLTPENYTTIITILNLI